MGSSCEGLLPLVTQVTLFVVLVRPKLLPSVIAKLTPSSETSGLTAATQTDTSAVTQEDRTGPEDNAHNAQMTSSQDVVTASRTYPMIASHSDVLFRSRRGALMSKQPPDNVTVEALQMTNFHSEFIDNRLLVLNRTAGVPANSVIAVDFSCTAPQQML